MAKFVGKIGFVRDVETYPGSGIFVEEAKDKTYRGDILMNFNRWQDASKVNEDLTIDNKFSFVSDSFALRNIGDMRYMEYLGTKWKIKSVEINYPRINITVGGLYNNG